PRAAVVVEDRYSQIFKQERLRPALVADGIAECQVRWPSIPVVFCETRSLAEEWTYRYLAAAHIWASSEASAIERIGEIPLPARPHEDATGATPAEIRAWARAEGLEVPERGRLPASIRLSWERTATKPWT
ncbi:MAG: Lsr2 family DNA-binding protein, partial [Acidimicrobiales bacterium]